ncbi:hypothetical protein D2V17_19140 [Aurantiacibacter xanthus]|uniref:SMI1/KNR4 family protein n=1 Tax=Aurantiacibacter xanthus TaxID=1784712 RepID=A0A3A1NYS6_9SPHN|nr:hypothetical protein [Aurantiacibacter xanthus]RIV80632.1 hypothetical protein D2V17_19140 [Aurantiacibacter xanthus]
MALTSLLAGIAEADGSAPHKPAADTGAINDLLCTDGRTRIAAPPEFRSFYAFHNGWALRQIQLIWPHPHDIAQQMQRPGIADLLAADLDRRILPVPEASRQNTVLISWDYSPAPYQRAYALFRSAADYSIIDAGSEIIRYSSLAAYLGFWRDVLRA